MLVRARVLTATAILIALASSSVAQTRVPVWIDTDPALGEPERDVDDGFALVQAFRSPELEIRGISVVFGNAPLARGVPIAQRLVTQFGPPPLRVFAGASSAASLGIETDASRALAEALRVEPMTILAFGPATNVATCSVGIRSLPAGFSESLPWPGDVRVSTSRPGRPTRGDIATSISSWTLKPFGC